MAAGAIAPDDPKLVLNLLCSKERDTWRIRTGPHWVPRHLRDYFDRHGEAYPVALDFEDLERHMNLREAPYEMRVSNIGSVELTARGRAAVELGSWLSTMFATGIRVPGPGADGHTSPKTSDSPRGDAGGQAACVDQRRADAPRPPT